MGGWEGVAFLAVGVVHGWLVVDVCGWGPNNVNIFMSLVIYVWAFVGLLLGPPLVMATCVSMQ